MSREAAEAIVIAAQRKGDLVGVRISVPEDEDRPDPWTLPPSRKRIELPINEPLPKSAQLIRANLLYVEKRGLPSAMQNRLLRLAAFQNPEFYKAQSMRPFQEEAVSGITSHDDGILCAPTAFGKTAVAAWLIVEREVNTLILVHRQQLMD